MTPRLALLAAALVGAHCSLAHAQSPTDSSTPAPVRGNEPKVETIVIVDDGTRIEELRVRGQTQRITVQPRNMKGYEILPATQGRDMSDSAGSQRGAAGKRVWNMLDF